MPCGRASRTIRDERVRAACVAMGVDREMTALVLASHRRDPGAFEDRPGGVGDLPGYVRSRIARWDAIVGDD